MRRLRKLIAKEEDQVQKVSTVDVDMMQKLRNEVRNDFKRKNDTNMMMLSELDEADVRHDKCPQCKYEPLVRKEGFKICPACGNIYKMLDGKGYILKD